MSSCYDKHLSCVIASHIVVISQSKFTFTRLVILCRLFSAQCTRTALSNVPNILPNVFLLLWTISAVSLLRFRCLVSAGCGSLTGCPTNSSCPDICLVVDCHYHFILVFGIVQTWRVLSTSIGLRGTNKLRNNYKFSSVDGSLVWSSGAKNGQY